MAKIDLKNILDDIRARDAAILNLLLVTDQRSLALFRIYVTLAAALASAAVASVVGEGKAPLAQNWVAHSASVAAIGLLIGCAYCLAAMKTAKIAFPGKGAEFWQWATGDVEEPDLIQAYLAQSLAGQSNNFDVNTVASKALRMAKRLGPISVGAGGLVALAGAVGWTASFWAVVCRP
ncbi:hypothetical protein FHT98_0621 [Bosea sp. AK1]|uniref:hypothetical protein n=1 Tax=Bosea sp. AK1 TaxID=2587160 RepID=UPI001153C9A8|nr:hypothetical protein [Bosea sp. AK1]TQI72901.1 hypothetical protein FHT98_0621 [Bosea sp. AK1]